MGRKRHPEPLTPAEQRVLEEVRTGATNAEIAVRLGLSINTVKYHVANMLAKTGLDDRAALARWEMPREPGRLARWRLRGAMAGAIGVAAAALVILGLLLGDSHTAEPRGIWVAHVLGGDGPPADRIVIHELLSGTERELGASPGKVFLGAYWSPDGSLLLSHEASTSLATASLMIFERGSWRRKEIGLDIADLAWSPDSQRVAARGFPELRILGRDGRVLHTFIPNTTGDVTRLAGAAWSPDSQFYAYLLNDSIVVAERDGPVRQFKADETNLPFGFDQAGLAGFADSASVILGGVASGDGPPRFFTLDLRTLVAEEADASIAARFSNDEGIDLANRHPGEVVLGGPRLSADGRARVYMLFTPGQDSQATAVVIADTEYEVPLLGFQGPERGNFSVVLTGEWPSPVSASTATNPP